MVVRTPEEVLLRLYPVTVLKWLYDVNLRHLAETCPDLFKAFVSPPAGYELLPLETVPNSAGSRYSCAEKAIADLRLIAEYIAQGHLKYTKSERIALGSLKILRQLTGGPEFFENPNGSDFALLRTRLLVGGMAFAGNKERENLLARPDHAEPVRDLFEKVSANAPFLHEELLAHMANSRNRWCQYNSQAVKHFTSFFGKLPAGRWVSWKNLRSYHTLREQVPSLVAPATGNLQAYTMTRGKTWSTCVDVSARNGFELVSEPLLKGYAFLLAAFGMAEIACVLPTHPTYHRANKEYLTVYDGLQFVRLTPLGEFVFGQRKTLEMADGPPSRAAIILDAARLLATCRNADQLTERAMSPARVAAARNTTSVVWSKTRRPLGPRRRRRPTLLRNSAKPRKPPETRNVKGNGKNGTKGAQRSQRPILQPRPNPLPASRIGRH